MTGDASKFTHISPKKSGYVTYGDNSKGRILGVGKIDILDEISESLEDMHIFMEKITKEKEMEIMKILKLMKSKQMMIFQENGELLDIILLTTSLVIYQKG